MYVPIAIPKLIVITIAPNDNTINIRVMVSLQLPSNGADYETKENHYYNLPSQ